jgi:hypothetical protein
MKDNTRNASLVVLLCLITSIVRAASAPFSLDWLITNPHYASLDINNHGTFTQLMLPIQTGRRSLWYGGVQSHALYTQLGSLVSIGTGYRYLMAPQWMLSGHLYVDGAKLPHGLGFYSKLNPGIGIHSIIGGITLNAYLPIMMPGADPSQLRRYTRTYYQKHQEWEPQYIEPNHWGVDCKLSFVLFSRLTGFTGAYYMPQSSNWTSHPAPIASSKVPLRKKHSTDGSIEGQREIKSYYILGGIGGVEYEVSPILKINAKYSFDRFRGHYITGGVRFEHNTYPTKRLTPGRLLWQPTHRHIGPISINRECVIRDNIYFLKVAEPDSNAIATKTIEASYEKPAILNNKFILNALTEQTRTLKEPVSFYIASGFDNNQERIAVNIHETFLYGNQSLYGKDPEFRTIKPSQLGLNLRPMLAGVLKLHKGNNVISDLTFCPELSGQYRYHIKANELDQQVTGKKILQETSIAIGNQPKHGGPFIQNITIKNVDIGGALKPKLNEDVVLPSRNDQPNELKALTSTLYYDTAIAISKAAHVILDNIKINSAKTGLALEKVNHMELYNSAIGERGTGSVMQGIWTKQAKEIKLKNSTMEGMECALNATDKSDIEVRFSRLGMFSNKMNQVAAAVYSMDSNISIKGTKYNNSILSVSARNAETITPVVISKSTPDGVENTQKASNPLALSYTTIEYVIPEDYKLRSPKLLRLLTLVPIKDVSITDCAFDIVFDVYNKGYKLPSSEKIVEENEGWIYKNNNDRVYSRKEKSPGTIPISSTLPVLSPHINNIIRKQFLSNVAALFAQDNWNSLPEYTQNEMVFDSLQFDDQFKVIEASNLTAEQKIAARYRLIFEKKGMPLPRSEVALVVKKELWGEDPQASNDSVDLIRAYAAETILKKVMYGPETQEIKLKFVMDLNLKNKEYAKMLISEAITFENHAERVMELEKELGKDKAHLILKETLLEGLKSEQFDLDHLKREAQSHEAQLKEETRNQLVDQMKGTVPLQEKGKSRIDNNQTPDALRVGRRKSTHNDLEKSKEKAIPPELQITPPLKNYPRLGLPAHPAVTKDQFIKGHPVPKEAELPAKELSPQELTAENEERFKNIYRKLENDEGLSNEDLEFFKEKVQKKEYNRAMERLSVPIDPKRPNGLPPHPRVYKNKKLYRKARSSHVKDNGQSSNNIEVASIMDEIAPSKHLPYPVSPDEKPPRRRDKEQKRFSVLPYPVKDSF